jgi:hypothetical protein
MDHNMNDNTLSESIRRQHDALRGHLEKPMRDLAHRLAPLWGNADDIDSALNQAISTCDDLPCNLVYVVDQDRRQVSANVAPATTDVSARGQDLSKRPYFASVKPIDGCALSGVYISRATRTSCVTAVCEIRSDDTPESSLLGYLAADFELRALPQPEAASQDRRVWMQVKGDPSIRGTLFQQTRTHSAMDDRMEEVVDLITELMTERGIFHGKLHFSSARATMWLYDDPYRYRVHPIQEILDPNLCLAYPRRPYPEQAIVPADQVRVIFERFARLRSADETIYLRAASLNTINGIVGLNFSCDGSHYMPYEEFLSKGESFWFGEAVVCPIPG